MRKNLILFGAVLILLSLPLVFSGDGVVGGGTTTYIVTGGAPPTCDITTTPPTWVQDSSPYIVGGASGEMKCFQSTAIAPGTCCPATQTCNPTSGVCTSNPIQHICGNGVIERPNDVGLFEQCDGTNLDFFTCNNLRDILTASDIDTITCTDDCTTDCLGNVFFGDTNNCGDGTLDDYELCDIVSGASEFQDATGYVDGTLTCEDFGYEGCDNIVVDLTSSECTDSCTPELDACAICPPADLCGNEIIDNIGTYTEDCDGPILSSAWDCILAGFPTAGTLGCSACAFTCDTGGPVTVSACSEVPEGDCNTATVAEVEDLPQALYDLLAEGIPEITLQDVEDFCEGTLYTYSGEDPSGKPVCVDFIGCGCVWDNGVGGCVERPYFTECGGSTEYSCSISSELLDKCASDDVYELSWTADYLDVNGAPVSPQTIIDERLNTCLPGSKTYPCPSTTNIPFFTLTNLFISMFFIMGIYLLMGKKR